MPDHQGRIIGVVQVLNKRARPFDADDEALLATVAAHAGIAIENSKLYQSVVAKNEALLDAQEELRQRIRELDLLVEIEQEASAALDLDELLDRLLVARDAAARRRGGLGAAARARLGRAVLPHRRSGDGADALHSGEAARGRRHRRLGGAAQAAADRERPDARRAPRPVHRREDRRAGAQHPGRAAGARASTGRRSRARRHRAAQQARRPTASTSGDLKLLTLIAGQASSAIVLARSREEQLHPDRLASIGQMLSGVLHDLKTPMTIVSGYAQLMAQIDDAQAARAATSS